VVKASCVDGKNNMVFILKTRSTYLEIKEIVHGMSIFYSNNKVPLVLKFHMCRNKNGR